MKVEITPEVVRQAVEVGNTTYANIQRFIALTNRVNLSDVNYNEVKKVAKTLIIPGVVIGKRTTQKPQEKIFLTDILAKYNLTRSTPKLEKEMVSEGWVRMKTETFPNRVYFVR